MTNLRKLTRSPLHWGYETTTWAEDFILMYELYPSGRVLLLPDSLISLRVSWTSFLIFLPAARYQLKTCPSSSPSSKHTHGPLHPFCQQLLPASALLGAGSRASRVSSLTLLSSGSPEGRRDDQRESWHMRVESGVHAFP